MFLKVTVLGASLSKMFGAAGHDGLFACGKPCAERPARGVWLVCLIVCLFVVTVAVRAGRKVNAARVSSQVFDFVAG